MFIRLASVALVASLSACAFSSVQQMSADTFQVSVTSAPICGSSGAVNVASKIAAIETIKRGADRYLILNAQSGSEFSGLIASRKTQGIVVKVPQPSDPDYARSLSARQVLGPDWQQIVASGRPATC